MIYKYYLSLGSNITPRELYMRQAMAELESFGAVIKKSAIYESEPWGRKNQSKFLNAVIFFQSWLNPFELLNSIKHLEKSIGRKKRLRWGPREIDIDIIFCENITIQHHSLKIPHENFQKRKFVLLPMMELDKNYPIDGTESTIESVFNRCKDLTNIKQVSMNW